MKTFSISPIFKGSVTGCNSLKMNCTNNLPMNRTLKTNRKILISLIMSLNLV